MNINSKRSFLVIAVFAVVGLIFIISLFRLQVLDSEYKQFATNNVLREVVQYPARGLVYDRNGKLLVYNKTAYDLLITPREVGKFDTTLFCNLLQISKSDLEAGIQKTKKYSRYKPSTLIKQISPEMFAVLQEQLYKFEGFHTQSRTLREYSSTAAAHALGYVGEVTGADLKKDEYYKSGDYIGISGIEKTYEKQLRGVKGVKKNLVDVHNRIQGSYRNGSEDVPAQIGKNITSTLDLELQLYAEQLFRNKKGSVVAIEPSTGEVLAMVSAPTYDPGLLVGRVRGANYAALLSDTLKPLFNRSLQAKYPPGSTFKPINTLIGLQEQVINLNTRFACYGKGSSPIRCTHDHVSPANVVDAIRESCNPFLWNTFRSILYNYKTSAEGFNVWRNYVESFGIGKNLSSDFANGLKGDLPPESLFNRIYGEGHWNAMTVRSLAIGQGELGVTPLQMANYGAVLANRGYYFSPHIIKGIEDDTISQSFKTRVNSLIDKTHFEPIIEGMQQVTMGSMAASIKIDSIDFCGKTGTVENPHGSDHSVFVAFAPKENPQIAIFVYVEYGVWGSRYAAPMASLMMEKYLTRSISKRRKYTEKRMMDANVLNPNQPK
ncbi:MAG: penicillin-binding protein 2 [Bacteroidetes bacterium]|nr:penicillin-binding protein 2 [Bacteroidota bacterium]